MDSHVRERQGNTRRTKTLSTRKVGCASRKPLHHRVVRCSNMHTKDHISIISGSANCAEGGSKPRTNSLSRLQFNVVKLKPQHKINVYLVMCLKTPLHYFRRGREIRWKARKPLKDSCHLRHSERRSLSLLRWWGYKSRPTTWDSIVKLYQHIPQDLFCKIA